MGAKRVYLIVAASIFSDLNDTEKQTILYETTTTIFIDDILFCSLCTRRNTEAETREKMIHTLSMGLSTYFHQMSRKLYEKREKQEAGEIVEESVSSTEEEKDPWNNWVFNYGC